MMLKSIFNFVVISSLIFTVSCNEEISAPSRTLNAVTNKTIFQSEEEILIHIHNNLDKKIYMQKCGESLYPFIERLDSGQTGGSFTIVCRMMTSYKIDSNSSYVDTIRVLPGIYRLKYYYDYEDKLPVSFEEILFTNEFKVE